MQQQEVLELIESIVRPLRVKIEHLQRQNNQLKTQMSSLLPQQPKTQRMRSISRQQERTPKKDDTKEARSPSIKKKDDRPAWGYAKVGRQENAIYKSPPPAQKNKYKQVQPRISTRPESKEKQIRSSKDKAQLQKRDSVEYLSFEKQPVEPKKIMGGQKFSESGSMKSGSMNGDKLKESQQTNGKINPEHAPSQEASSAGNSHLSKVSKELDQ